jgi:hypothetical protein
MNPSITTDLKSPADIIALSKARRLSGQSESGPDRQARVRGRALTLPEDVVTLSSHQTDSSMPLPPVRKMKSLPVTSSEKNALLGADTPPYRLSIYG